MNGYSDNYSRHNELNNKGMHGRYSHMQTEQKDKILVDSQRHDLNVERRIFEREGMFNMDTRNTDSSTFYKNKSQDSDKRFGEITGDVFNASDLEQGMPMRDFLINEKNLLQKPDTQNSYLDFDVYDKQATTEPVSYFDPHQNGTLSNKIFSDVNESKPLLRQYEKEDVNQTFGNNINSNSLYLFNGIRSSVNKESKIIMSPLGILLSLMLLYVGSSNETTEELKDFFKFSDKNTMYDIGKDMRKIIKNSEFITQHNIVYVPNDVPLNTAFQQYISELGAIDVLNMSKLNSEFHRINGIIDNLTNGTINNALGSKTLRYNTRIMCINTMIIKPKWINSFPKELTSKAMFNSFTSRKIDMMMQKNVKCLFVEDNMHQLVELDLRNQFMMGFIISQKNTIPMIQYNQLYNYWKQLEEVGLDYVQIPKFRYQCRYKIDSLLKRLGLINIFLDGTFGNICSSANGINVTDIVHHAVISVDEGGISNISSSINKSIYNKYFIANKPFIFYIRHYPTNTLVTMGIYV